MRLKRIPHIPSNVRDLTFLADGRIAYTVRNAEGQPEDRLYITDLNGLEISRYAMEINGGISASPTDPDKILIVGTDTIQLWSRATADRRLKMFGGSLPNFPVHTHGREAKHTLVWSGDGRFVAVVGRPAGPVRRRGRADDLARAGLAIGRAQVVVEVIELDARLTPRRAVAEVRRALRVCAGRHGEERPRRQHRQDPAVSLHTALSSARHPGPSEDSSGPQTR